MLLRTETVHSIQISGILRKCYSKQLKIVVGKYPGQIKIHHLIPPIFGIVSKVNIREPLYFLKKPIYLRNLLIATSRNPRLLCNSEWRYFSAQFEIEPNLQIYGLHSIEATVENKKMNFFINRDVARHGFFTDVLDLSLDYELKRSFRKYDLIISSAVQNFFGLKVPNKKRMFLSQLKETYESRNSKALDLIKQSFFIKFIDELNSPNNSFYQTRLEIKNEITGNVKTGPFELLKNSTIKNLWTVKTLENAKILHGQVIYCEGSFWIPDKHSLPEWGEITNLWPGLIRQNRDQLYSSPKTEVSTVRNIKEAIYFGGTNNFMHFVIDDLPKLIISDRESVNQKVPIILKEGLSQQIMETISAITNRKIVVLQTYEICEVKKLHFYSFNNPLRKVMQGEVQSVPDLFDINLLEEARTHIAKASIDNIEGLRILIARERGLFRPLINSKKVRKELESKFGFKTVFCGNLSLEEAQSIFSMAEIVVAEYGAAIANIVFMHRPGKVVEIRGPLEKGALEYQTLVEVLGNKHYLMVGKLKKLSRFGISKGPYKISVSNLSKLVKGIIDGS